MLNLITVHGIIWRKLKRKSNGNQLEINNESSGEHPTVPPKQDKEELGTNKTSIKNQIDISTEDEQNSNSPTKTQTITTSTAKLKLIDSSKDDTTLDTIFRLTGHQKRYLCLFLSDVLRELC